MNLIRLDIVKLVATSVSPTTLQAILWTICNLLADPTVGKSFNTMLFEQEKLLEKLLEAIFRQANYHYFIYTSFILDLINVSEGKNFVALIEDFKLLELVVRYIQKGN